MKKFQIISIIGVLVIIALFFIITSFDVDVSNIVIIMPAFGEQPIDEGIMKRTLVGGIDITMASPIEGYSDASVTIIEFGDYQCPKCKQWFNHEKQTIVENYIKTDKAKFYFIDAPFLGEDSIAAANASYCAYDQGKYWEYHDVLYTSQDRINHGWSNNDALEQFAVDIELDIKKFNACLDSEKYHDWVLFNIAESDFHEVEETPTFFIVGEDNTSIRIEGPQPASVFAAEIDSLLDETHRMETETQLQKDTKGGGCLIATAAFGSELAPQVQFLREVRDNTVMNTVSGAAFMTGFNQLYYSFSPTIADMERESPVFKEAVKLFITPMISSLSIMTLAEDGSEYDVLTAGIPVIVLNLAMYIVAPIITGIVIHRRFKLMKIQ